MPSVFRVCDQYLSRRGSLLRVGEWPTMVEQVENNYYPAPSNLQNINNQVAPSGPVDTPTSLLDSKVHYKKKKNTKKASSPIYRAKLLHPETHHHLSLELYLEGEGNYHLMVKGKGDSIDLGYCGSVVGSDPGEVIVNFQRYVRDLTKSLHGLQDYLGLR